MYINRIENRITFKIKNEYYLELLTPETADKITSASKKSHYEVNNEIPEERYIYTKERRKIIDELKLT